MELFGRQRRERRPPGTTTLDPGTDTLDFANTLLGGWRHPFNGGGGSAGEVLARVTSLSASLTAAGVEHGFEVYEEERNLVCKNPSSLKGHAG